MWWWATASAFGVPMGYGGPHAAFFATRLGVLKRNVPGRVIGASDGPHGPRGLSHGLCKPGSSTSGETRPPANICTAQSLCSRSWRASYAVYHGPKGLAGHFADRVHALAVALRRMRGKARQGMLPVHGPFLRYRGLCHGGRWKCGDGTRAERKRDQPALLPRRCPRGRVLP